MNSANVAVEPLPATAPACSPESPPVDLEIPQLAAPDSPVEESPACPAVDSPVESSVPAKSPVETPVLYPVEIVVEPRVDSSLAPDEIVSEPTVDCQFESSVPTPR